MGSPERGGVFRKTKDKVLWVAEKSTYVTVPAALLAIVSGGISPAVGISAILLDIGGALVARRLRSKNKSKQNG